MSRLLITALVGLWLCAGTVAAQDAALYEGEAPVADQSADLRAGALPRALAQVLVKVTGDGDAGSDPALAGSVANAAKLMQQYRYRQDVVTSSGSPELRLTLIARFDRDAVDALVARAGRTVWPTPRPQPVLWLAIDDGSGPRLVGQAQSGAVASLTRRGVERGLTLSLPKGDLQDQTLGGAQAVWREDAGAVRSAAARYGQAPVLLGRMQRDAGGWTANWTLLDAGSTLGRWSSSHADAATVLAAGADGAATTLARSYSSLILSGTAGDYDIIVTGLTGATDYGRTLQYLQGLPIVQAVQVSEAIDDRVALRLSLRTGVEGFSRLVASGRVLAAAPGDAQDVPVFRLGQ